MKQRSQHHNYFSFGCTNIIFAYYDNKILACVKDQLTAISGKNLKVALDDVALTPFASIAIALCFVTVLQILRQKPVSSLSCIEIRWRVSKYSFKFCLLIILPFREKVEGVKNIAIAILEKLCGSNIMLSSMHHILENTLPIFC